MYSAGKLIECTVQLCLTLEYYEEAQIANIFCFSKISNSVSLMRRERTPYHQYIMEFAKAIGYTRDAIEVDQEIKEALQFESDLYRTTSPPDGRGISASLSKMNLSEITSLSPHVRKPNSTYCTACNN